MIERTKQEQAVAANLADAGCGNELIEQFEVPEELPEGADPAFAAAQEPKELVIVPGADHVDLYDNFEKIPFDKLETLGDAAHINTLREWEKEM